jgi:hypothetical protein
MVENYSELFSSVYRASHYMPVHGFEDVSLESLQEELQNSQKLLEDISKTTETLEKVSELAEKMQGYLSLFSLPFPLPLVVVHPSHLSTPFSVLEMMTTNEIEELQECKGLLLELSSLGNYEHSLLIQSIQQSQMELQELQLNKPK